MAQPIMIIAGLLTSCWPCSDVDLCSQRTFLLPHLVEGCGPVLPCCPLACCMSMLRASVGAFAVSVLPLPVLCRACCISTEKAFCATACSAGCLHRQHPHQDPVPSCLLHEHAQDICRLRQLHDVAATFASAFARPAA